MNKNSKKNKQRVRRSNPFRSTPLQPPEYIANTIVSRVFRFQYVFPTANTPQTFSITPAKLGALQVVGTTANTTATQLFEAVRIRKIEVWSSTANPGIIDIGLSYVGSALGIAGPNRTYSNQSIGMTRVAYVSAKPGKETQAAQWQNTATNVGTNTIFTIVFSALGAGTQNVPCTIDVHLALRMTSDARITNNTVALTTVALTGMYYLALDNAAGGTGSSGNDLLPDRNLVSTT
jgi:hypothetical protein